jgi:predicted nucleic acid-binding protein
MIFILAFLSGDSPPALAGLPPFRYYRDSRPVDSRTDGTSFHAAYSVRRFVCQPIGNADPMFAAIAIGQQLDLVTGNTAHYQRIQQLG